jgi:hypothetical protein
MASVRQRRHTADYLSVGETFEFMGTGFTQVDDSPSATTSSKRYVNMRSESQSITGYSWTSPFTFDEIDSEKAIAFLVRIGKEELLGDDAETDYISVDLNGTKNTEGAYPARQRHVAVKVSEFSDSDGELTGSGNLLAKGDWEFGYFDVTTKAFTQSDEAKEAFSYAEALK